MAAVKLLLELHCLRVIGREFFEEFQLADLQPFVKRGEVSQSFVDQVMEETMKASHEAIVQSWASMLQEDHSEACRNITCRALLIWGTSDGVFVESEQMRLVELLQNAQLVKVSGAPHGVHWTHPSDVAVAIENWL